MQDDFVNNVILTFNLTDYDDNIVIARWFCKQCYINNIIDTCMFTMLTSNLIFAVAIATTIMKYNHITTIHSLLK